MTKKDENKTLMVVRLRGGINTIPKIKVTLKLLRLNKVMHSIIIGSNKRMVGMLQIVKDYVTWGEIEEKVLADMIKKRGRLVGNIPITDSYIKDVSDFKDIDGFASAIIKGNVRYKDLKDVKPLFRLHPPIGGLRSTKQHFTIGGDLGYRGMAINDLVSKMIDPPIQKEKKKRDSGRPKKTKGPTHKKPAKRNVKRSQKSKSQKPGKKKTKKIAKKITEKNAKKAVKKKNL